MANPIILHYYEKREETRIDCLSLATLDNIKQNEHDNSPVNCARATNGTAAWFCTSISCAHDRGFRALAVRGDHNTRHIYFIIRRRKGRLRFTFTCHSSKPTTILSLSSRRACVLTRSLSLPLATRDRADANRTHTTHRSSHQTDSAERR